MVSRESTASVPGMRRTWRASVRRSFGASIGLVRKSFMPAASACSRSDTSAAAVSAMIGSALALACLAQLDARPRGRS